MIHPGETRFHPRAPSNNRQPDFTTTWPWIDRSRSELEAAGGTPPPTAARTAADLRWSEVGITGVSSSNSIGVLNVERSKNAIKGGRCAQGWYHLCISSPGAADLFLRANSSGAEMELARIIVKHKRCYATGRWVEKRLGPYADHTLCRPSHIGADGSRLCNGASCCQGTQSTQSGAANLNMNRDGTIIGFVPNRNESSGR